MISKERLMDNFSYLCSRFKLLCLIYCEQQSTHRKNNEFYVVYKKKKSYPIIVMEKYFVCRYRQKLMVLRLIVLEKFRVGIDFVW